MDSPQLIVLSALALVASMCVYNRAEAQTPPNVLAAQIRAQGYHCKAPLSAKRDAKRSKLSGFSNAVGRLSGSDLIPIWRRGLKS